MRVGLDGVIEGRPSSASAVPSTGQSICNGSKHARARACVAHAVSAIEPLHVGAIASAAHFSPARAGSLSALLCGVVSCRAGFVAAKRQTQGLQPRSRTRTPPTRRPTVSPATGYPLQARWLGLVFSGASVVQQWCNSGAAVMRQWCVCVCASLTTAAAASFCVCRCAPPTQATLPQRRHFRCKRCRPATVENATPNRRRSTLFGAASRRQRKAACRCGSTGNGSAAAQVRWCLHHHHARALDYRSAVGLVEARGCPPFSSSKYLPNLHSPTGQRAPLALRNAGQRRLACRHGVRKTCGTQIVIRFVFLSGVWATTLVCGGGG